MPTKPSTYWRGKLRQERFNTSSRTYHMPHVSIEQWLTISRCPTGAKTQQEFNFKMWLGCICRAIHSVIHVLQLHTTKGIRWGLKYLCKGYCCLIPRWEGLSVNYLAIIMYMIQNYFHTRDLIPQGSAHRKEKVKARFFIQLFSILSCTSCRSLHSGCSDPWIAKWLKNVYTCETCRWKFTLLDTFWTKASGPKTSLLASHMTSRKYSACFSIQHFPEPICSLQLSNLVGWLFSSVCLNLSELTSCFHLVMETNVVGEQPLDLLLDPPDRIPWVKQAREREKRQGRYNIMGHLVRSTISVDSVQPFSQ